ncbi:ABA4-like family protein [Hyphococcus sp.]|uniref:ABA4-like family protein n=1 Tax=Hyphococcus sp. TaxID=2038636 RepID=UPI003CCC4378
MSEQFNFAPETVFSLANQLALAGWIILILLPRRYALLFAIPQYVIPLALSLLYAGLMFSNVYTVQGGYGSIDAVRALFSKDELLLAGWVHYLAFDLFIGAWIARQADGLGVPRLIQAALLLATFMFGPVGLALFMVMRAAYREKEAAQ